MGRRGKTVLVLSLILNVALIVGLVWGKQVVERQGFKMAALATDAEARLQEYTLKELESGDQERIESLKDFLARGIERGKEASAIWNDAATR